MVVTRGSGGCPLEQRCDLHVLQSAHVVRLYLPATILDGAVPPKGGQAAYFWPRNNVGLEPCRLSSGARVH